MNDANRWILLLLSMISVSAELAECYADDFLLFWFYEKIQVLGLILYPNEKFMLGNRWDLLISHKIYVLTKPV